MLGSRDVRLLLLGQAVSQAGDWLYSVALVVFVLDATGSAVWVAAIELAHLVPWVVVAPFAGLLADRVDRRHVLVAGDLVQLVAMLVLAGVAAAGGGPVPALIVAAVASTTAVVANPSLQASIPALIDERGLASVNALMSAIMNVAIIVGPAVGGVLLILGSPAAAFGLNAVTFGVSAACFAVIRTPLGPAPGDAARAAGAAGGDGAPAPAHLGAVARSVGRDLRAGVAAIAGSRLATALVAVSAGALAAYGLQTVLWAILADERLGIGTDAITLLYVANGIGGLLATVPASRAASGRSAAAILAASAILAGASVAALALAFGLPSAMLLVGLQGFLVSILDVLAITLLQRSLGPLVLGRALGAMDSITSISMIIGTILAPLAVAWGGLGAGFLVAGLIVAATGVVVAVAARGRAVPAMVAEERVRLLAGLSLFSGAPRFALEGFAADCRELLVPAGTVVIREGDAPDALFVIVDGTAEVTSGPERRHLNEMGAGDFFGEIGLLKGIPRTATVTTTAPSTLLRIEGETFLALVRTGVAHRGVLGRNVGARLSERRPARRGVASST